ncbi:hypothetical protein MHBO_004502, partial [Bonamia ostreae]
MGELKRSRKEAERRKQQEQKERREQQEKEAEEREKQEEKEKEKRKQQEEKERRECEEANKKATELYEKQKLKEIKNKNRNREYQKSKKQKNKKEVTIYEREYSTIEDEKDGEARANTDKDYKTDLQQNLFSDKRILVPVSRSERSAKKGAYLDETSENEKLSEAAAIPESSYQESLGFPVQESIATESEYIENLDRPFNLTGRQKETSKSLICQETGGPSECHCANLSISQIDKQNRTEKKNFLTTASDEPDEVVSEYCYKLESREYRCIPE